MIPMRSAGSRAAKVSDRRRVRIGSGSGRMRIEVRACGAEGVDSSRISRSHGLQLAGNRGETRSHPCVPSGCRFTFQTVSPSSPLPGTASRLEVSALDLLGVGLGLDWCRLAGVAAG
jgi:hypothetical protein